jgi:osmotically-inducible protein OsmY
VGGFALVDRRTVGAQTDDRSIELKAASRLGDALESAGGITVTSYNRRVLLKGQAIDAQSRRTAESIVAKIENVRSVQNELAIGRRPSLSSSASDAALTTRVRTSLLEAKDLQSNAVKIVTESGVVYLLGIVTKPEGDRFAELASRVSGVLRVVTMFEYVSEEELARITQNASADKK